MGVGFSLLFVLLFVFCSWSQRSHLGLWWVTEEGLKKKLPAIQQPWDRVTEMAGGRWPFQDTTPWLTSSREFQILLTTPLHVIIFWLHSWINQTERAEPLGSIALSGVAFNSQEWLQHISFSREPYQKIHSTPVHCRLLFLPFLWNTLQLRTVKGWGFLLRCALCGLGV